MKKFLSLAAVAAIGFAGFTTRAEITKVSQLVGTYECYYETDQFDSNFNFLSYDTNPVVTKGTEPNELIFTNVFAEAMEGYSSSPIGTNSFKGYLDVENQVIVIPNKQNLNEDYSLWISLWEWEPTLTITYPESFICVIEEDGTLAFSLKTADGQEPAYGITDIKATEEKDDGFPALEPNCYDIKCKPVDVGNGDDDGDDDNGDDDNGEGGGDNSAVNSIDSENQPAVYFDIYGRKVSNPEKGSIVIRVQGGKAVKSIF